MAPNPPDMGSRATCRLDPESVTLFIRTATVEEDVCGPR
jgi:hypothetical protein